jgi:hypothetical protein
MACHLAYERRVSLALYKVLVPPRTSLSPRPWFLVVDLVECLKHNNRVFPDDDHPNSFIQSEYLGSVDGEPASRIADIKGSRILYSKWPTAGLVGERSWSSCSFGAADVSTFLLNFRANDLGNSFRDAFEHFLRLRRSPPAYRSQLRPYHATAQGRPWYRTSKGLRHRRRCQMPDVKKWRKISPAYRSHLRPYHAPPEDGHGIEGQSACGDGRDTRYRM